MINFFKKTWDTWLLLAIVLAAYGQTLFMYFWHDDYTILYLAQQGKLLDYPYQMNSLLGNAVAWVFGSNATYYFILAIALYFLSVVVFKLFIYLLTKDKVISFVCAAVFASGYVGQVAMEMLLGNGLVVLPGMILFFICLIALIKYIDLFKNKWLFLSLISFVLTLEIAPHRYAAFLVVVLGIFVLNLTREKLKHYVAPILAFGFVTYLELFVHPTKILLDYKTGTMGNISPFLLAAVNGRNIMNLFGSFWNTIFPTMFQRLLFVNRPASFYDTLSIASGLAVFLFIVLLLLLKVPKYSRAAWIFLVLIFGSLMTFFIIIPEVILESEHRYLMTISYASAIVPLVMVGKKGKKTVSVLAGTLIILLHLSAGIITQREFVNSYSTHARNIFLQLKSYLPAIDGPKIIYIEGSTKALNYAVGDAFRVGAFPSEIVIAVQYKTNIENVILPESLDQLADFVSKNKKISLQNTFTFIYDGKSLKNTSPVTRRLIESPPLPAYIPVEKWRVDERGLLFNPDFPIHSLAPLFLKGSMSVSRNISGEKAIIRWQYNTSGNIREKMEEVIELTPGKNSFNIKIPAGGEYLSKIRIDYNRSKLNVRVDYAKISYKE